MGKSIELRINNNLVNVEKVNIKSKEMIDSKELRIGNYVRSINLNEDVQIDSIYQRERGIFDYGIICFDGFFSGSQYSHIKPIPLTEQWLLDFGFALNTVCSEYQKPINKSIRSVGYFGITYNNFMFNDGGYCFKIKYVHQLQNLFYALTKKELTKNVEV